MHPYLAHLIGDFLLQTEWMATNKKDKFIAIFVHVLVYLVPFVFTDLAWWQIVVIGLLHGAQDHSGFVMWWIRFWKKTPEENMGMLPMIIDQVFHLVVIHIVMQISI
jgi:hypothetical protein